MNDLDIRLQRLAAEATRDAVPPELDTVDRRARRRDGARGQDAPGGSAGPQPWASTSDVTVFLPTATTEAQRAAVRARLEAIDGVAKVTYETPAEAYRRLPEKLRGTAGTRPR